MPAASNPARMDLIPFREPIARFCRKHHIRRLALFGSVLREDFGPESDLDVLVEFEPDRIPGWAFFGMQDELGELLRRRVDLNTPRFLGRSFRDQVQAEALPLYEADRDVWTTAS